MPITFGPLGVGDPLGFGFELQPTSDVQGRADPGDFWRVSFLDIGEETLTAYGESHPGDTTNNLPLRIGANPAAIPAPTFRGLRDGDQFNLVLDWHNADGTIRDSGSQRQQFSSTMNLPVVIRAQSQVQGGGGGLTDTQAQQLDETHAATAPLVSLDDLTLTNLTPSGPQGGFVNAQLPGPIFGVIVRLANIPAELLPITPDGDYWVKTLAVVRIYRGSDLWIRAPVHTSSKIVPLTMEGLVVAVAEALTNLWLLNLSVQVSFLEGVTGSVFLMNFP